MYHPNGQPRFQQNVPYQQAHPAPMPFQQQQFDSRFQAPSQQFNTPGSFYQSSQQHHEHSRPPYQRPILTQPFFPSSNHSLEQIPKSSYQLPTQNVVATPNPRYLNPSVNSGFNQQPHFRTLGQTYDHSLHNYNQPPPIQNFNRPPVQNYNQPPPIQNFNQPPPVQHFNQPITSPYRPVNPPFQNSPYPSSNPGFSATPNTHLKPQVHIPESLKQPYKLPVDQCYQQQQSSCNLPRPVFNQRLPFRHQGQHRFPFKNQQPRYQQLQTGNNRLQFHPQQQYQNYRPRIPSTNFNNQINGNSEPKTQIACELGECDFVGHASAVKEHQNMHHRLGLHKKVLYSNNSDAINKWIEERKKKWPTKKTIQIKLEEEDEKNKRGERIADEDFQRFNKNNKLNNSGSKRFNNRKRPKHNGDFVEPIEEPMNGKLKRFAGIIGIQNEDKKIDEINKPVVLKLLEEYDESSDDEPPDETVIVKESTSQETVHNTKLCSAESLKHNEEVLSTSEIGVSIKLNKKVNSNIFSGNDSEIEKTEVKIENSLKVNEDNYNLESESGQKRKKSSKKEFKQIKKQPPLRTPRTEVVERKGALLEALMGDLMRSERNAITQCICYIRKNMNRFCKIQAA